MFIKHFLRWLRGWVCFCASGNFPERLLNLLSQNKIEAWGFEKKDGELYACVYARQYKRLRPLAKRCKVRCRIVKKSGFPFRRRRYRKRWGLLIGLAVFLAFLAVMSQFVWSIEVVGNERVETSQILQALERWGLYKGAYRGNLDVRKLEANLVIAFDDLSWAGVNLNGTHVQVQVNERILPPQMVVSDTPCNIIAARDGQITYMEVYEGQAMLKVGDTVVAGDLIVSGVMGDSVGHSTLKQARAVVMAEVEETIQIKVNWRQSYKRPVDGINKQRAFSFLGFEIPLYLQNRLTPNITLGTKQYTASLFGYTLPFAAIEQQYAPFAVEYVEIDRQTAEEKAHALLEHKLQYEYPGSEVLQSEYTFEETEDCLILTANLKILENIAKTQEIFIKD